VDWDSVVVIATTPLAVRSGGSNIGGGEIFHVRPDWPWGPPSLLHNTYRVSFLGLKRTGHFVYHPPHIGLLATGWTVRGSNPGGGEIFLTFPDRPWEPHSLLYNGYRVFPWGKERPRPDADPSPPSSAVVKKG